MELPSRVRAVKETLRSIDSHDLQRRTRDSVVWSSDAIAIVSCGVAMQSLFCCLDQRCIRYAIATVLCTSAMHSLCLQKRWVRYHVPPLCSPSRRPKPIGAFVTTFVRATRPRVMASYVWRGYCPLGQFCSKKSRSLGKDKGRQKVIKIIANPLYGSHCHEDIESWK